MATTRVKRRVLVTGATGFIGRYAVADLVRRGYDVHATYVGREHPKMPAVTWHEINLLKNGAASSVVSSVRPYGLLHLAWYAKHGAFWTAIENLHWVRASIELAEAFVEFGGRRLVVSGTSAEYSWHSHEPLDEIRSLVAPHTLYGTSKDALRRVLAAYCEQTGTSFAWGRVFFLYGPGEQPARFVTAVATALMRGETARCSHGKQIRDFLHVEDVGEAFSALLDCEVTGVINIASGRGVALGQIAAKLLRIIRTGEVELGAIPAPQFDPPVLIGRARRLRREVGFHPRYSLDEGLRLTVADLSLKDATLRAANSPDSNES